MVPSDGIRRNVARIPRALLALLPILLAAPASSQPLPPYNRVYGIATHNSYWLDRSDQRDYFAGGAQEILTDQLLHDHVHALEIDVHSEGAPAHQWKVYHTSDAEDFTCRYLSDCLEYLRTFHYAVPQHEVINVVIELKNSVSWTGVTTPGIHTHYNFADDHTIEDFDAIFRSVLGSSLFTPADFLSRCDPGVSLLQCAKTKGWPTVDELRGRFIITILGVWSTAAYDWVQYATSNVRDRVAFPVQTVFELDGGNCPEVDPAAAELVGYDYPKTDLELDGRVYCVTDIDDRFDPSPRIDPLLRQAAFDESVFWQVENTWQLSPGSAAQEAVSSFLADYGIVRGANSFDFGPGCSSDCQEHRIQAGFQLIQTDFPWHFVDDAAWSTLGIPVDPSRRLKSQAVVFNEPGSRLYFQTAPEYPGVWVYGAAPAVSERWLETTVSSTRHGDTWGKTDGFNLGFSAYDYLRTCPSAAPPTPIEEGLGATHCTDFARAAQEDGEGCIKVMSDSETEGLEICRQKNTEPGPSYYQESVDLYVRVFRGGRNVREEQLRASRYGPCKSSDDPNSDDVSDLCIGSLIAVAVKSDGQSSTVSVYSAGRLGPSWLPEWSLLASETFAVPVTKQGYRGWKSELLAGLRSADRLIPTGSANDWRPDFSRLHQITLADLPNRKDATSAFSRVAPLSFPASRVASVTRATLSPAPSAAGWNNTDVTLTLTAPPTLFLAGAAVRSIEYSLAGAQTLPGPQTSGNPATIHLSAEGVTTASFHAVDNDGTAERAQSIPVAIDRTPPRIAPVVSPPPNAYGWNRTPVTVTFDCSDALSGVLSCAGGPAGLSAEGAGQTVSGTARDRALNGASATAVVNIDMTPPTIRFSGNLGTYTVDQTVAILCTAADSLSGIASSSCVPIEGPAYSFDIGLNTFTAEVVDRADNAAAAQTSFEVKVTYTSLCNLTARFSSRTGEARALCQKLQNAQDAEAQGNLTAKAGKLKAYANQVSAQSGKALTTEEAAILGRLVTFL